MSAFNLPTGVGVHDIPGNERSVPVAAPRGNRPRMGKHLRVIFTASVDAETGKRIDVWTGRGKRAVSRGIILDQLVAFAKARNFTPKLK